MPDFHCRARSYLSFRLGIKICCIVTRLLLQVLFSLLSCTSMSAMPAIHHPCHTPLYSILFHPIPITKFLFLLFSSLLFHLQVDLVQNSSLNRNPKNPRPVHSFSTPTFPLP